MSLVRDAVGHFVGRVGTTILGFLTTLYVAHALGPAGVGRYALAVALATWLSIPPVAVARAVSKRLSEAGDGGYATAGALLVAVLAGVLAVVVVLSGPVIHHFAGVNPGFVAALTASLAGYHLASNLYIGRERVAMTGVLATVERLARLAVTVALVSLGAGVNGVVAAHALTIPLVWSGGLVYHRQLIAPAMPSIAHAADLVTYSTYIWMDAVRSRAFGWTDTLVLGVFVAPSLVGVYEVAWRISQAATAVASSIQRAVFPRISTRDASGLREVRDLVGASLAWPGVVAIPAIAGALVLGRRVFLVYGRDFAVAGAMPVVVLLLGSALVLAYAQQYLSALNAVGEHARAFRINAFLIGTNLVANVLLVATIGWVGAAVASLLVTVVALLVATESVTAVMGRPRWPVTAVGRQTLAAGAMAAVVMAIDRAVHVATVPTLLATVAVGGVVYAAALYQLSPEIRTKLTDVIDRTVDAKGVE